MGARRGAKEETEEEEGAREGRREQKREGARGDYTIIQITAGYNLVADVSRSTMPTTHRRACVCAYTLTEFQCTASSHRAEKKKKTAANEPAHNYSTSLCLGKFLSLMHMRQSVKIMTESLFSPEQRNA